MAEKQNQAAYPSSPVDFTGWQRKFNELLKNGSDAHRGLQKWVQNEKRQREANIAQFNRAIEHHGLTQEAAKKLLDDREKPDSARTDLIERLYRESNPVEVKSSPLSKSDMQLISRMKRLAQEIEAFAIQIDKGPQTLSTQDGFFEVTIGALRNPCLGLSSLLSQQVDRILRPYTQAPDIIDRCLPLIFVMEDRAGLSQRECHDLIRIALLAHGCGHAEVAPFAERRESDSISRGTIRNRKRSTKQDFFDSIHTMLYGSESVKEARKNTKKPIKNGSSRDASGK
ncbi:hypothetical protein [Occallatibacter savannae]|uniref:hypothetical protein n=1 Tax=Occallatibacter savannae TaxID=1002691 RepID=UPI000D69ACAD|nr:hypothetical protein [Occallatibacter savannae]